jgi:hypothetical protein
MDILAGAFVGDNKAPRKHRRLHAAYLLFEQAKL